MMICIYDKKETDFSRNGLAVLGECQTCKVIEKLNGVYELKLSYPIHLKKASFLIPFNIIKADGQLFRIYSIEKDSKSNLVHVNARHIFYDLLNYLIEDKRPENKNCKEAMEIVIGELGPNAIYSVDSDITTQATQYIIRRNIAEAMFMIVNRWHGELFRDNFNIQIKAPKEGSSGLLVQYGKNILGINEKINTDEVLTAIYPVGANGITLPEKYLMNPLWNGTDYPSFALVKKVDFKDAQDEEALRAEAQRYLDDHDDFDVNYQIDFIQLEQTNEYENYKSLLKVKVGDNVIVRHALLGIDIKIKVISIEKDLLSAQNTKVELGKPLYTLDQYIEEVQLKSETAVEDTIKHVDTSVGNLQNQLDEIGVSYSVVSNLTVGDGVINVTYEVEKDSVTKFSAEYTFTADGNGRMTGIQLQNITSKLLLKEVSTLTVSTANFTITYVDGTTGTYNYTTDSNGRITGISKE